MKKLTRCIVFFLLCASCAFAQYTHVYPDIQYKEHKIPLVEYQLTTARVRCHLYENKDVYTLSSNDNWGATFDYFKNEDSTATHSIAGVVSNGTNIVDFSFATTNLSQYGRYIGRLMLTNASQTRTWGTFDLDIRKNPPAGSSTPLALRTPFSWSSVDAVDYPDSDQLGPNPTANYVLQTDGTTNSWVLLTADGYLLADGSVAWTAAHNAGGQNLTNWVDCIYLGSAGLSKIRADTADAADQKVLMLCGGGDRQTTRGGMVWISGNESSINAVDNGTVQIYSGTTAGAYVLVDSGTSTLTLNYNGELDVGCTVDMQSNILTNLGVLALSETSEPSDPADGKAVIWFSNGTGAGSDGDLLIKKTVAGVTTTNTFDTTQL